VENTNVMTPHSIRLPRQKHETNLAVFQAGLGILIIEGKKEKRSLRRPFLFSATEAKQGIRTPRITQRNNEIKFNSCPISGFEAPTSKKELKAPGHSRLRSKSNDMNRIPELETTKTSRMKQLAKNAPPGGCRRKKAELAHESGLVFGWCSEFTPRRWLRPQRSGQCAHG
jgi:hypothetical protein